MCSENCFAWCFLDWDQFGTEFDKMWKHVVNGTADQKYNEGLEIGRQLEEIHISQTGVWSGPTKDGGYLTSYERIGYHVCTKDLLHGFLDSGTPIFVHRWEDNGIDHYKIK